MTGRRPPRWVAVGLVVAAFVVGALGAALAPREAHRRAIDQLRPVPGGGAPDDPGVPIG